MVKIDPFETPEPDTHKEILGRRRTPITDPAVSKALESRFHEYDKACPALLKLSPLSGTLVPYKEDLKSLYVSEIVPARELRRSIRDLALDRCPYCGRHGKPKTLDHFLPKDDFPEFSLYYKNLIPCCWACNHAKRKQLWDANGARLVLNPYFDSFLSQAFVIVTILPNPRTGSFDTPKFEFTFDRHIVNVNDYQTCISHFEMMKFRSDMRIWLGKKLRAVRRSYSKRIKRGRLSPIELEEEIEDWIDISVDEHGINSWEAIFYRSIKSNKQLIDFIASNPYEPSPAVRTKK